MLIPATHLSLLGLLDAGCCRASMRNTQAGDRVPNSPANPLPTAFYGPEIPLPADPRNRVQITDLQHIFDDEARISGTERRFFAAVRGNAAPPRVVVQCVYAGASTSTLMPRAATASSRQVSSSIGTPF